MSIEAEKIDKVVNIDSVYGGVNIDAKRATSVKVIVDNIKQRTLDELTFDDFNDVLNEFEDYIQKLLLPLGSTINKSFTPKKVYDLHQTQMFIPEVNISDISSTKLWEGWLLFLAYLHIVKPTVSIGNYKVTLNDGNEIKIDFLFNEDNRKFSTLVHDLLASNTFKTKKSDIFIFNNSNGNLKPNVLTNQRRENIIVDFTVANPLMEEVIGEHKFACLHIANITDNIAILETQGLAQLKNDIKNKIIEVFEDVLS